LIARRANLEMVQGRMAEELAKSRLVRGPHRSAALGTWILLAGLAAAMGGCAGSSGSASVTGNEQGGKVPYAEGGLPGAMDAAKAHCSQFGKKAAITQMTPAAEGGVIGFQCR
jgi:hypothetical protein